MSYLGAGLYPAEKILKLPGQYFFLNEEEVEDQNLLTVDFVDTDKITKEFEVWKSEKGEKSPISFPVPKDLDKKQEIKYKEVIRNAGAIFAYSIADLKVCKIGKHVIKLVPDASPIYSHPYRISLKDRDSLRIENRKKCWDMEL